MTNRIATTLLTLAAALAAGGTALATDRAPTRAPAEVQLAAAGGALGEGEIRSVLTGRTAHYERQRGGRTIIIDLSFGANGTVRHRCRVETVMTRRHNTPQCRKPSGSGTWSVAGRRLCIMMGQKRCYRVIRTGGGYVFRPAAGTGQPYAGRFTLR